MLARLKCSGRYAVEIGSVKRGKEFSLRRAKRTNTRRKQAVCAASCAGVSKEGQERQNPPQRARRF
ncbi:MAG: hypothetical protein LBU73_05090 [Helicobacteraceae bacterium]|jgi:hypothetical protein|nr:hypothetical protein [Helicobacteraceae bacterium]